LHLHESTYSWPALTDGEVSPQVPLSGFFLDRENVHDEPVFHGQAMGMYALANSSTGVPRNCVAERPDDPASCIFSEHAYDSIQSPIFVVDSQGNIHLPPQ
jgi:hypothetical protein